MTPLEELDHILSTRYGSERFPEILHLLRQVTLVFLVPYHPEVLGDISLPPGQMPKFILWTTKQGERHLPIFTSARHAQKACKKTRRRDGTYAFGEMEGQPLFDLLARQPNPVIINPACSTFDFSLDHNAVKMLADGSLLALPAGKTKEDVLSIVKPADYPTDFLQPIFQFLRRRPEVRAAWLLREPRPPGAPEYFVFLLNTSGDRGSLDADLRIVANAARGNCDYGIGHYDPTNPSLMALTAAHTPFYAAPDYPAPGPLRDEGTGKG